MFLSYRATLRAQFRGYKNGQSIAHKMVMLQTWSIRNSAVHVVL